MNAEINFKPIGVIHTEFTQLDNMPIQPMGAKGCEATIDLREDLVAGLKDLEGFSHIILLYYLHKVNDYRLSVVPFMDNEEHGLFATRTPCRPNPIGISTVQLIRIEGNLLFVEGADVLDGTPLLDIKPFFSKLDNRPDAVSGWLDEKWQEKNPEIKSDRRFIK